MSNSIILVISIALDYVLGDSPSWPHPVRFIGAAIKKYEKLIRSLNLDLKVGGFILTAATIVTVLVVSTVALVLAEMIHPLLKIFIEIYLIYALLAAKCLDTETMKVYKALESNDMTKSRQMLSYLVGRDTTHLNSEDIIRGAIETVAENTIDGVLAPLFYLGIGFCFNIPVQAILLYKTINTLDSMVGYIQEPYTKIGYASAKLDDIANLIPARLGSILMILAGMILGYNGKKGMQILVRDRHNHKSPNCGYPESAVAGLLEIQLGGTNTYFGQKVYKPAIGDAHRELNIYHIKDTIKIMYGAELVTAVFMIILLSFI
ncbi:adenosylcobinamide-phosphate synthase CbiB [Proteiniborus sp. MB09-C3]|uniref:adenosylcobinamide-phosphate synthase CbiB n=1 Tax=Proteiniborus sp. MB09-C3 TaxID=3050072 RepID=UPI0025570A9A|nr:adenosylcobinamide-phosphate synthase CbiB [Proteiniborus sp. MB09-C3]WIV11819.1 adenosylcobinamide-phosphate synthase CbiB [Proteiniborus sp. MB09-C3]